MSRFTLFITVVVAALAIASAPAQATDTYEPGEIIVVLNHGYSIDDVNATWGTTTLDSYPAARLYLIYESDPVDLEALADQMELTDPIDEAEANYLEDTPEGVRQMIFVAVGGTLSDFEDQGLTDRIGLTEAHTVAQGKGVLVAVIDTGVDPTHELFLGRLSPDGYDFIDEDTEPWETLDGIDSDGDQAVDEGYGHGTMVAGIISLVAPQSTLLPIRALDDDGTADAWTLARAIHYAVEKGADVINLSLGVPQTVSIVGSQLDVAYDNEVIIVAAAGNENRDEPAYYPADDSKSIMVTAVDSTDIKADFADYGSKVLVTAPGTGVRSAYPGGWAIGDGCSFATPFVAGEAALIKSRWPLLWAEQIENIIESAVDYIEHLPGNAPYDGELGSGRIYLPDAVQSAVVDVAETPAAPRGALVFPNPARRSVRITFGAAAADGQLTATVFDAAGRRVASLLSRDGSVFDWDTRTDTGRAAPAGVYFVRLWDGRRETTANVRLIR